MIFAQGNITVVFLVEIFMKGEKFLLIWYDMGYTA